MAMWSVMYVNFNFLFDIQVESYWNILNTICKTWNYISVDFKSLKKKITQRKVCSKNAETCIWTYLVYFCIYVVYDKTMISNLPFSTTWYEKDDLMIGRESPFLLVITRPSDIMASWRYWTAVVTVVSIALPFTTVNETIILPKKQQINNGASIQ